MKILTFFAILFCTPGIFFLLYVCPRLPKKQHIELIKQLDEEVEKDFYGIKS